MDRLRVGSLRLDSRLHHGLPAVVQKEQEEIGSAPSEMAGLFLWFDPWFDFVPACGSIAVRCAEICNDLSAYML